MRGKLFLVQWDDAAAKDRSRDLRADGWNVKIESQKAERAEAIIKKNPPDVVVVDLEQSPEAGEKVLRGIREVQMKMGLPVFFVGGSEANQLAAGESVPNAIFTTSSNLKDELQHLSKRKS